VTQRCAGTPSRTWKGFYSLAVTVSFLPPHSLAVAQERRETPAPEAYFKLEKPREILSRHQRWEGDQFPHTLSVLEMNREGFRYWGWYGLNDGGGVGLARSNDLVHWVKYRKNPLLTNARWPSVIANANPNDPGLLYVAYTRDYDTPTSHIVLGSTHDGIHIDVVKILVQPVTDQRNQNPNLFHDPRTGRFYLTWYRGNAHSEIVSRNAERVEDLDRATDKVLLASGETIAAPTLLYLPRGVGANQPQSGTYYLATEIRPQEIEWQTKVFTANVADGDFRLLPGNPVLRGGRACLFQHIFRNRFYGYICHEISEDEWTLEVIQGTLPTR
jgi:hypothetical protein